MSKPARPFPVTKRNPNGELRGRPSGDGITDMPDPAKRTTRPGATTVDIIRRIVLARRLPDGADEIDKLDIPEADKAELKIRSKVDSYFSHAGFSKIEQDGPAEDAVRRWLRDPGRSNPPVPKGRRRAVSAEKHSKTKD